MSHQGTQVEIPDEAPPRTPSGRRTGVGDTSHARSWSRGFFVKLVVVAIADAVSVYGILTAAAVQSWGVAAFLLVALVAITWVYFSRRGLPAKYLLPGLLFLLVYQLFVMGYTAYVAFTNYGDGHNSTKSDAVAQILVQNEKRVEGSATYPLTVVDKAGTVGFAVVVDGKAEVGSASQPLTAVDGATVDGGKVTAVPGWQVLDFASIAGRQDEIVNLRVPFSSNPDDGSLRTQDAQNGYLYRSALTYDAAADTMTDTSTGTVYQPDSRGSFVSPDGTALTPGWRVAVGFSNFTQMFTDSRLSGPFTQILVWTFVFAGLSVLTTFALGLFLAITFNDPRVRGRRIYRSLLILPYAFPAFLSALVWRGMLNQRFGYVNEVLLGGANVPWLTDGTLAKVSVLMVNLWLGFPYMFLVCTGALQSIPTDIIESARMDGASPFRIFRSMTLPLLMISVAPLLISSFAFNFNNFSLIYMLTGGGPSFTGTPVLIGHTDILISMVYAVAFGSGLKQYGLASAVSILIFIVVGAISWWGFRRTRTLEEL
ncbi:Maltose/maltodextrin transport system permease protein MalF [Cellulomonas sp. T2.31MG-18]|uniref:ABC transporter permease subunit n=1 Tax=Cellulomonas sp. T2.31MG-18 TaxID=3157619 RepID=UPI0035E990A8